jgi:hypothetical protein
MSLDRKILGAIALAFALALALTGARAASSRDGGGAGEGVPVAAGAADAADAAGASVAATAPTAKTAVLARLARLNQSGQFLFGQEHATLWGMYLNDAVVSTSKWFEATARAGHFTSDSAALVGDDPAVLGVSLGMLAYEPPEWNRRAAAAEAIRRQIAQGGLVTMDWHAASCDAGARSGGVLATVKVNGRDVAIRSVMGGNFFYAEEEYRHPIASRADVPESLKCLCQIANDAPLTGGPDKGLTGKTWMVAQAKYAAQVLRAAGLSGLPIIMRPFHEHTGSWFWWGQPYWNCAALLARPDAVSGPDAYKAMARTYISTLRSEPGMNNLLFAYSPDRLLGAGQPEAKFTLAENRVGDPTGHARDLLRERLLRELGAVGLAYVSPAERAATLSPAQATSAARADRYVAQRRPYYLEAYAGDDLFDVLGIDLYHPMARAANRADLQLFRLQLRVLADEARARGKPYALTEAGTYRLQLLQLAKQAAPGRPLPINGRPSVDEALARLFDPADRAALLRHFGLSAPGPISLSAAQRAAVVPHASEDWFNQQLLVLAKEAKVAYALVWQTYHDSAATDRYFFYYIPYPGHPDAGSFRRFHDDPATCFLRDACGR